MPVTHERWLVALSLIVAIQGAYVGLSLAVQVAESAGLRRRLLLAGAALSLAVAIWAMHFVGMLAARLPFPVDYLVLPTLLSFLVCVIVVGAAVYATSSGPLTLVRLTLSAGLMGVGIFSMHYIGMAALHASAHMIHAHALCGGQHGGCDRRIRPRTVACDRPGRAPAADPVGDRLRCCGVGNALHRHGGADGFPSRDRRLDRACAFDRSAGDRRCRRGVLRVGPVPAVSRAGPHATNRPSPRRYPPLRASRPRLPKSSSAAAAMRPLGGIGAPPRRFARHLPVERDGATHHIAVETIVAVHANAHYTTIFDGTAKLFCPLPISDVETRLDTSRFVRVHRSHIVNIERVIRLKRAGDSGLVELDAPDHVCGASEP